MVKLNQKMQDRLDEWRKGLIKTPQVEMKKVERSKNYIPRGDYGDNIQDFEQKDLLNWKNSPSCHNPYGYYR